ncbi:MAG TPA: DUF3488 and transglutaminase-like domain-containing protein [Kocuria rosea]|nr:DUF3488 and transglutaminase-like domain-containing protein [Kocuria rosea]
MRPPAGGVLGLAATVLTTVVLSLVALAGVLDGTAWLPGAMLAALAVVAATAVSRAVGLPPVLAPLFGAGALVLLLTVLFLREPALLGFVPTPGGLAAAEALWRDAAGVVRERPAPYPAGRALSFVAALGTGLVALLVDVLLVGLRLPVLAGAGVLAVLVVPALVLPHSVGPAGTAAAALAALVLLGGGRRWGAVREPPTAAAPGSWPRALVVVAGVVAVTVLVPGVVPGFVNGAFPQGSGLAGERAAGVGPLRAVGQDLRSGEQAPRLEYTTASGEPELLRVLSLEDFTGDEWFPAAEDLEEDLDGLGATPLNPVGPGEQRTAAVTLRNWSERWLPLPWVPVAVTGLGGDGWSWSPRDLAVHADDVPEPGTAYEVRSVAPEPTAAQLRAAPAAPAGEPLDPFRALPEDTPAALRDAAHRHAGSAATAFDQALALQEWLRSDEFRYDVDTPVAQGYDAGGMSALERFLQERAGYAGHFAPAMAVMARELGIPARVAVGYLPPAQDAAGDPFARPGADTPVPVRPRDAHAWPELWFEGVGWVRFEPTPGTGEVPGYAAETPAEEPTEEPTGTAPPTAEPTQSPSDDPTSTQTSSPEPAVTGAPTEEAAPPGDSDDGPRAWLPWAAAALAAALLALLLALPRLVRDRRRARRVRRLADPSAAPGDRALAGWAEVEDLAADHGLARAAAETPRTFVARLAHAVPPAGESLRRLGDDAERALYAAPGTAWSPGSGPGDVAALRAGLAQRPGARRARWLPRSVLRGR